MHLIYVDEVKYKMPEQPYYWMCGVAVDKLALEFADAAVRDVAEWYFGTRKLDVSTELHGKHIANGTSHFKGHGADRRLELYRKLIDCLCGNEGIQRIIVRIDPSKIVHGKEPAEAAFMFFVEKSDALMRKCCSLGVLIADADDKQTKSHNVSRLSRYRGSQTEWHFGRQILNLVDTVHHTQSHHSRMVQLADVFVYACQLQQREKLPWLKQQVYEYAKEKNLYYAATYKHWPTNSSWYE